MQEGLDKVALRDDGYLQALERQMAKKKQRVADQVAFRWHAWRRLAGRAPPRARDVPRRRCPAWGSRRSESCPVAAIRMLLDAQEESAGL